jgi:Putative carbonic anhydrase
MGKCSNLLLHCMDYRIQQTIEKWIHDNNYIGDIDRISFGGPCSNKEFALKNIQICCAVHGVTNVFLSQHEDCAGYGGHDAFPSIEAEHNVLTSDMMDLKSQVKQMFPEVNVITLLVQEDGDEWKIVVV